MSESNRNRAERLFDAVGAIDDKHIQDAMSPAKAREHIAYRKKKRITVTCAACICCIIVGVLLRIPGLDNQPPSNSPTPDHSDKAHAQTETSRQDPPDGNGHTPEEVSLSLEYVLTSNASSQRITKLSADEIDLHDRDAKLIWQYEGEEHSNVAAITESSSLRLIIAELDRPLTDLSADESDRIGVKLWISYGDGRVDSPYLKHTSGNTGYGVLFDYCAEVEPNADLTEAVLKLLI